MSESMLGNFSGKIGIPEGAFKRLSNKQAESALEFIIQNQINLTQVITDNQGGAGNIKWLRAKADGTKVAGSSELTCTRTGEGTYKITSSVGFTSTGGYYQVGVVATPSTVAGDGGDGTSPFKARSATDAAPTGDTGLGFHPEMTIEYSPADGNIYVASSLEDKVYKHTLSDFLGTVGEIATSENIYDQEGEFSCMDREGTYLWISTLENDSLKAIKISDGSVLDFGNLGVSRLLPVGAAMIGGVYYLVAFEIFNGRLNRYSPNMSTPSLGTKSSIVDADIVSTIARNGCWDGDNNLWVHVNTANLVDGITQINVAGLSYVRHDWPADLPSSTARQSPTRMVYDTLRDEIYVSLTTGTADANQSAIYRMHSWAAATPDSARFEKILPGYAPDGMWHDTGSDILYCVCWNPTWNVGDRVAIRFHLPSRTIIDIESVTGSYTMQGARCYYDEPYGYFLGRTGGGLNYVIRLNYSGAEIDPGGTGASQVSSLLTAQYQVTSATEAYVYLFRSLSPPIRADGEFSAHIAT